MSGPVSGQAIDEPQMPSSQRAKEAMCEGAENRPSWCAELAIGGAQSWKDGSWTVTSLSDDMDVDKQATVRTDLYSEDGRIVGWLSINVWNGGRLITHSANTGVPGNVFFNLPRQREGWPYCEGDLDRIAVDEERVQYLATIASGGRCNRIEASGGAIASMKRGRTAKVRLGSNIAVYSIDLTGFTAAMSRAAMLTRP